MADRKPVKKAARKRAAPPGAHEGGIHALAAQAAEQAEAMRTRLDENQVEEPAVETVTPHEARESDSRATVSTDEQAQGNDPDTTASHGNQEEPVGEIVGEIRPTDVGRENPTNSPTPSRSLFGGDRRHKVLGRKLHPRHESGQKNLTLRQFVIDAIMILADREGMSSQPGRVVDFLLERALREAAPHVIEQAYNDRCESIGIESDWK